MLWGKSSISSNLIPHRHVKYDVLFFMSKMAKKNTPTKKETAEAKNKSIVNECVTQYNHSFSQIQTIRNTWDEQEAMLLGHPKDSVTEKTTKAQVFDPIISNLIWERAARVMAQIQTGKVQALTKKDLGKSMFMDLALRHYVIPNSNVQWDMLTRSKIWDVYSNVYGTMGTLVDYTVSDDYVGPSFRLIPIRDIVPQSGKTTPEESDYIFVRSVVSKKWLLSRTQGEWKNIDKLLEKTRSHNPYSDLDNESYVEREYNRNDLLNDEKNDYEQIELITRYEKDRWVTFSRDSKVVIRDIENPQSNGKLPVVLKYSFPLLDRFFGLGEMERGQTLQYATNSLINLYLDGVKMSIFPPTKVYLPDIVAHTFVNEAGAKWVLKNNNPNAITDHQRSPQGLQTFQSTYQYLKGALLNNFGTSDTSVSSNTDIQQGKTPQALKMQAMRESARDNWDRFMMDRSMEQVMDRFVDLLSKKQEKPIKLQLMASELEMIAKHNPDVVDMFESGKYGEVIVKPGDIKNTPYKFFIDSGSSAKKDDEVEHEVLQNLTQQILQLPNAAEEAKQTGKVILGDKVINIAESFKRIYITSGIQDWEKIVTDISPEDMAALEQQRMQEQQLQQQQMQEQQMQKQMMQQPMQEQDPMAQMQQVQMEMGDPDTEAILQELRGGQL